MLNTTTDLKKNALKAFLSGFVVILLLALLAACLLIPHVFSQKSASNVFDEIELGASKSTVEQILGRNGIHCRLPIDGPKLIVVCDFSDFWRDYQVVVEADTNQVVRKSFTFRSPRQLINR